MQATSAADFLYSVQQRSKLMTLRSYLYAYTNVPLAKLAARCGVSVEVVRTQLDALVVCGLAKRSAATAAGDAADATGAECE